MKKHSVHLRAAGASAGQVALLVFVAAGAVRGFPTAQPAAQQGPDYNAYYQIGPDSLSHDGVPKGEVRGPFVLPSQAYPGTQHTYWVYVPAQYDPAVATSLMIFQDGQAFKDMDGQIRAPNVLDNLIYRREIPVMITVFINPGRTPEQPEPTPSDWGDRATNRPTEYNSLDDKYARVVVDELMPVLDKAYNISKDSDRHGIGGASSGAIAAFTVAWQRPNAFRKVLSIVGSFVNLRGGDAYADIVRQSDRKPIRIFLQDGRNDNRGVGRGGTYDQRRDWFYQNVRLMQALTDKGYDVNYTWGMNTHGQRMGGPILPEMMRWLWRDHPVSTDVNDAIERSFSGPKKNLQEGAATGADVVVRLDAHMDPPRWATLERQLLADNVPACREFFNKYFDDRGHLQCFVRWGANDGPDDAFENFNRWPELHALGAGDDVLQMFLKGHEGLLEQYTEARTTDVPIARQGMYYKEFIVQSDWMHHGEGLQLFNRMGLSIPTDAKYQERARRFAGFYMGEDPEAPNYDPVHKIIRSMENGSRGPMLRKATALDWVGDPFDVKGFDALHGESTFEQFLAHYEEYVDVVGDHFLNLVATTLPMNAYLLDGAPKYKAWIVEYMDAWLDRMKHNGGIIPSFVDLDGRIGGPEGKWWNNAYGWGFSPVNPVTGRREDRNRIPRALVGFNNALLVTGDQKYVDAWRTMIDAVNSHARPALSERSESKGEVNGRRQYPTMYGGDGWYGWRNAPWNVGALEVWYWSQRPQDLERVGGEAGWVGFLRGQNPAYPEQALERDLTTVQQRLNAVRRDTTPPERRLADNMLDYNPAATESMVQLMWGALLPGREGGLLNARLRYFDLDRKRAGVPEDVAALVSELSDTRTVVTLINLNVSQPRTVIVQGGGYGEHQLVSVTVGGRTTSINSPLLTVQLDPGCGQRLVLEMKRYANAPTVLHPWQRGPR